MRQINIFGPRVDWMNNNTFLVNLILATSLISASCFGYFIILKVWPIFLISGILSFFYVWQIPGLNGKNLRDLPGIKIYIIAVVWVLITVLLPYLVNPNLDLKSTGLLFFSEVLFMISITIPFDIRDINLDEASKKTIPQLIGVKKSIYISIALLLISQCLMQYILPSFNLSVVLITLITGVLLYFTTIKRIELYFSGLIDGLLILQPLLLWLFI